MQGQGQGIILKDSTMREGLDVPGVRLDAAQKKKLLERLVEVGIPEAEVVAPGHFTRDIASLKEINFQDLPIRLSGLVYGGDPARQDQIVEAINVLDRVDILIPLAEQRPPHERREKSRQMKEALYLARNSFEKVGAGFPHATQTEPQFLLQMCGEAVQAGARRITLYDTNGSGDPWSVSEIIRTVLGEIETEICFHAHNDLGMATANTVAAARAGARCRDVTVNGLGDRAGNASLEQVAMILYRKNMIHGVRLDMLRDLSRLVEDLTSMPVSQLAPVVGEFVFQHKSPGHLKTPELFEPFDPVLVGAERSLCRE